MNGQDPTKPKRPSPYQLYLLRRAMDIAAETNDPSAVQRFWFEVENQDPGNIEQMATTPSIPMGSLMEFVQGATFQWGDEGLGSIIGWASGIGGQKGRDLYRKELELYRQAHPVAAGAANVGGALTTGLATGMAIPGLGAGGPMAAGMVGGLEGGAHAVGAKTGYSERFENLVPAMFGGAAAGAVGHQVLSGAGTVLRKAKTSGTPQSNAFAAFAQRAGELMPGSPVVAARTGFVRALMRDYGVETEEAAVNEAIRIARERAAMGLPTTLADLGGDNIVAFARDAQKLWGAEQQAFARELYRRYGNEAVMLLGDLGKSLRVGVQGAEELTEHIANVGRAKAQPLYAKANLETVRVTDNMRTLMDNPVWRRLYAAAKAELDLQDANAIARGDAPLPTAPALPDDLTQLTDIPVRAIDETKKMIDHWVSGQLKEIDGLPQWSPGSQHGRTINESKNLILGEVDAQSASYRSARAISEEYLQKVGAIRAGRDFYSKSPTEIARDIANSPYPDEYRIGAIQAIADKLHGAPNRETADAARRYFGENLYRDTPSRDWEMIMALYGGDRKNAMAFADRLAMVAKGFDPNRSGSGIPQHGIPDPNAVAESFARPGVVRTPARRAGELAMGRPLQMSRDYGAQVANEVTGMFTRGLRGNPWEVVTFLETLPQAQQALRRSMAAGRNVAGSVGAAYSNPRR